MAWRNLHISNPARLKLREKQLVVIQDDGELTLAIEDIAVIVIDTPQITMTTSLMSAFAMQGVVVIFPDLRHHPCGILLPFHTHYAQAAIACLQIEVGLPLKKRLWQAIIRQKIANQAFVLRQRDSSQAKRLMAMQNHVQSGDPDNIEAQAARFYWRCLFDNFTRANEGDLRNALLNYGYAIVRAALARACVACGLLPAFGLHHQSKNNSFNLVDDLIEPFRPFVDWLIWQYMSQRNGGEEMNVEDRRHIVSIIQFPIRIDDGVTTLGSATEKCANSLVRAYENKSAALLVLPDWSDMRTNDEDE